MASCVVLSTDRPRTENLISPIEIVDSEDEELQLALMESLNPTANLNLGLDNKNTQ